MYNVYTFIDSCRIMQTCVLESSKSFKRGWGKGLKQESPKIPPLFVKKVNLAEYLFILFFNLLECRNTANVRPKKIGFYFSTSRFLTFLTICNLCLTVRFDICRKTKYCKNFLLILIPP